MMKCKQIYPFFACVLRLFALALLFAITQALSQPAQAQDSPIPRIGISPQSTPPGPDTGGYKSDEVFGTTSGYNLDQYLFRNSSPIRFPINITRVISRSKQGWRDLIVGQPQLKLRVYDVDRRAASPPVEIDKVYINGHLCASSQNPEGALDGADNTWSVFTFDIPKEWFENGWVKDATYKGPGIDPTPGENIITIDIDTLNGGWAVQCDWGAIYVKAMRPVTLIHGILSSTSAWDTFRTFIPGNLSEAYNVDAKGSTVANAALVRNDINATIKGFGVSETNMICHSKGGLDTYEASIGMGAKIENFITLASPLQGTEMAEHLRFGHPNYISILDAVYGGAIIARDLSVTERTAYYTRRPAVKDPGINYVSFTGNPLAATDAEAGCPLNGIPKPLGHGSNFIFSASPVFPFTTRNDKYVPINRAFHPFGSVQEYFPYLHTVINTENDVWDACYPILMANVDSGRYITNGVNPPGGKPITAASGGGQQTASHHLTVPALGMQTPQIPIDPSISVAFFNASYNPDEGDLDVTLITPSGQTITPAAQLANVQYFSAPIAPGLTIAGYIVANPQAGIWKMPLFSRRGVTVQTNCQLDTTLSLILTLSKTEFNHNEPLNLQATLNDGANPVSGASVTAVLEREGDGYRETFNLTQTAPGVYTSNYTPFRGGAYTVRVLAAGTPRGGYAYERESVLSAQVSPGTAAIGTVTAERSVDTDGDGLYNELDLDVDVDVASTGIFSLTGELTASTGETVGFANAQATLVPGHQSLTLLFDGTTLRQQGLNGPYTLSRVTLTDASPGVGLDTDTKTNLYTTRAYPFLQFQGPLIDVLHTGSDTAVDTNNNGLYDQLRVNLQVTVLPGGEGFYNFNAALQDLSGAPITFSAAGGQQLNVGTNTITLIYAGRDIGVAGLNGPYRVTNVYLFSSNSNGLQVNRSNVYQTKNYSASQFEGGQTGPRTIKAAGNAYLMDGSYRVTLALNTQKTSSSLQGDILINDNRSRLTMRSLLIRSLTLQSANLSLITGDCNVNGVSGYTYSLSVTDGTPTNSVDRFSLVIRDASNTVVRQVDNAISGGTLTISTN